MSLRPRPATLALTGLAAVTLVAASACSSGSDESPAPGPTGTASAQQPEKPVVDTPPTTPLDQVLLAAGEAPGNGLVQPIEAKATADQLAKWKAAQGKEMYTVAACDKAGRTDTPLNRVDSDGKAISIAYKDNTDEKKVHGFGIVLAPAKMDGFLDRAMYQACTASPRADVPNVTTTMTVSDAPAVPGATGFKVVTEHEGTEANGSKSHLRLVSFHGFAHGVTAAIDYTGISTDPNVPAVGPQAEGVLTELYTTQMTKLADAQ